MNKDSVKSDKFDIETDIPEYLDLPVRNSFDEGLNTKGKELLDLCKTFDLCIINGRKTGDHMGNFTSFQPGGNSVIDYAIASQSLFQNVLSFNVGRLLHPQEWTNFIGTVFPSLSRNW